MPLPQIVAPTYELTLPSNGLVVKYRPFLVKEEKILLMALEGGEEKEMVDAVRQIVGSCSITKLDVDELPTFDLEYFFLKLRMRSVGEVVEVPYRCQSRIDNKVCGNVVRMEVNLGDVEVEKVENNPVIMLTESIGIKLRYPRVELLRKVNEVRSKGKKSSTIEGALSLIAQCVDQIFDAENSWDRGSMSLKEIADFLDNLTQNQFAKIQEFFDNMPVLRHVVKFDCDVCGYQEDIVLEGMESFFV